MEDDTKTNTSCKDIARTLIEDLPGRNLNVILGGGLRSFIPDYEPPGRRKDERNLTADWMTNHPNGEYVTDRLEMLGISPATEHVLGIFAPSHMHFNADRNQELEPSLAEMTTTALKVLKRNNTRGFLLVVEAGKIDLAHHYNNAFRALDDTLALDEAIEVVVRNVGKLTQGNLADNRITGFLLLIDLNESLIIVTADHASAIVYSGFATPKEQPILGMDKHLSNIDKKPYQLILYSSGLGFDYYNQTSAVSDYRNSYHKAAIPSTWANHAGDDVPLYAVGPLANILFSGTLDQTFIPHAIAFAMCLSNYKERCETFDQKPSQIRTPDKIYKDMVYQVRQKLQKDVFSKQPTEPKVLEEVMVNFENISETDLYLTSDLIGNSTDENSGNTELSRGLGFIFSLFMVVCYCYLVL